ncbi:MAG TPA: hypothetical protein VGN42_10660 [Pirellulales bacterium]|jgi:tetratricopeptide (TPR) repeat protein|nr:hypothetical protein [Pirellulales bacterium]
MNWAWAKRIAWVAMLAWFAAGCGQSGAMREALDQTATARKAFDTGDLASAMRHLDQSLELHPTLEAYKLRTEIHCQAGRTGQAVDEANRALELWPSDQATRDLRRRCEIEDAKLRARFAEKNDALDRKERELWQRLAQRQIKELRSSIETSAYWARRTRTDREAYVQGVVEKGRDRVAQEALARQVRDGSDPDEQEARVQGWMKEIDSYHE